MLGILFPFLQRSTGFSKEVFSWEPFCFVKIRILASSPYPSIANSPAFSLGK